jgi:tellurite resistance protein
VRLFDRLVSRIHDAPHDANSDEAVIDLLALVSLADGVYGADEQNQIRAFVDGRQWPPDHNPETTLLTSIAEARDAVHDSVKLDALLDSICERLMQSSHRSFALEAADAMAAADDIVAPVERAIIEHVRRRLRLITG